MTTAHRFSWRLILFVALLHLIAYVVFIKPTWIQEIATREQAAMASLVGDKSAHATQQRATNTFTEWFVNSGVRDTSYRMFLPSAEHRAKDDPLKFFGSGLWPWVEARLDAFWWLVYQVCLRVSSFITWSPLILLSLAPFLIDAMVVRRIKQQGFAMTSPHLQAFAVVCLLGMVLLGFLLTFAPIYMPPALVPLSMLLASAACWMAVGQFVKRG